MVGTTIHKVKLSCVLLTIRKILHDKSASILANRLILFTSLFEVLMLFQLPVSYSNWQAMQIVISKIFC